MQNYHGKIFAVYKPKGMTSHDVIDQLRKITGERRIGHAGTLDPLAEGVLVVGVGREATKRLAHEVAKEKEYSAKIFIGKTSTTDDEEGEKTQGEVEKIPSQKKIESVLSGFVGSISQIPPQYSAVKIKGRAAYAYARHGKGISLKPREVQIFDIILIRYEWPELEIKVVTGPGVYIRALARDIGEKLGSGAYLSGLVRIRVGDFNLSRALDLSLLH